MNRTILHCLRLTALSSFLATCAAVAPAQTSSAATTAQSSTVPVAVTAGAKAGTKELEVVAFSSSLPEAAPEANSTAGAGETAAPDPAEGALPEAPDASLPVAVPGSLLFLPQGQAAPTVAPKLTKYIPSGWTAQSLTAHDKVLLGLRDLYSPLDLIAVFAAAGYEHVLNGEPNYGTDRGAFGQRLGAAAIREGSQGLLTDSVFSPLFREDPRYYVQGAGHGLFYRAAYAATRPFITRTDSGNSTINAALLAGYAGSAALSYTYYPSINRNFHDTVATFGGSLGGAALGYAVSEFSDDLLKAVHLRKK